MTADYMLNPVYWFTMTDIEPHEDEVSIIINGLQVSNSSILTGLIEEAESASHDVKNCLKSYCLNTSTKQLRSMFHNTKKPVIVETLKFLKAANRDWNDYTKEACLLELICRVQNLLIDKCQFCNQHYAVSKNEESLLQCSLCGQGVHMECLKSLLGEAFSETQLTPKDVQELINPYNINSLKFMCLECSNTTLPQSSDGLKKSVAKKSTSPITTIKVVDAEVQQGDCTESINQITVSIDRDTNTEQKTQERPSPDPPLVSPEDCKLYRIGQCPHGISGKTEVDGFRCKFTHRKRCRKFCKFGTKHKYGCKNGNNCDYFHPVLCKYSVQRGLCTNLECKFAHLKGTKRFYKRPNYGQSGVNYTNNRHVYNEQNETYHTQNGQRPSNTSNRNTYQCDYNVQQANDYDGLHYDVEEYPPLGSSLAHNSSQGGGYGPPSGGRNAVKGPITNPELPSHNNNNNTINTNNNKCFLDLLQMVRVMQENQQSFQREFLEMKSLIQPHYQIGQIPYILNSKYNHTSSLTFNLKSISP